MGESKRILGGEWIVVMVEWFLHETSGTSLTVRGLEKGVAPPFAMDLREGFTMEFRIKGFRLLIAELRKSAINNRKSSFKDDRHRDWLSTGNVEEPKNAPQ